MRFIWELFSLVLQELFELIKIILVALIPDLSSGFSITVCGIFAYQGSCLSIGNGSRTSSNLIEERSLGSRIAVGSRRSRWGSHHPVSEPSSTLRFAYLYFQLVGFFKSKNLNSLQKKRDPDQRSEFVKKKKMKIRDYSVLSYSILWYRSFHHS